MTGVLLFNHKTTRLGSHSTVAKLLTECDVSVQISTGDILRAAEKKGQAGLCQRNASPSMMAAQREF